VIWLNVKNVSTVVIVIGTLVIVGVTYAIVVVQSQKTLIQANFKKIRRIYAQKSTKKS